MFATALAASAALVAGCSQSTTTGWKADNSTYAQSDKTMYLFFPQVAVYYQPDVKTWYWYEDDCWFKSHVVPTVISQHNFRPAVVELKSPTSFETEAVVFAGFNRQHARYNTRTANATIATQRQNFTTSAREGTTQQQGAFATGQSNRPNN
jgi:hypothetical protein